MKIPDPAELRAGTWSALDEQGASAGRGSIRSTTGRVIAGQQYGVAAKAGIAQQAGAVVSRKPLESCGLQVGKGPSRAVGASLFRRQQDTPIQSIEAIAARYGR